VAIVFRLVLIIPVTYWLGASEDRFKGNEPSHIAAHIVRGEGFSSPYTERPIPTAQQPPLYPLFVAGIFKLFGVYSHLSLILIMVANAIAGGFACLFIYRIGLKYFSPVVALIAAWAWAVLPPVAVTDLALSHYSFSTLLVLAWLAIIPNFPLRVSHWTLLGIAIGLALLLNPMLVLLIPASFPWLWARKKYACILLVMMAITVMPWHVRNFRVMGHVYPGLRDNLGLELYIGNHPGMNGVQDYLTGESAYKGHAVESEFMQTRQRDAIAYITSDFAQFLLRSGKRLLSFWLLPWPMFYLAVISLAVLGIFSMPQDFAWFNLFMLVIYPVVFYVTQTSWPTSYRHPIEPLLLIAAAVSISRFMLGWKTKFVMRESEVTA
jgi:Dolichyl-phosphate-mannose-protein mannosyltransferase